MPIVYYKVNGKNYNQKLRTKKQAMELLKVIKSDKAFSNVKLEMRKTKNKKATKQKSQPRGLLDLSQYM